VLQLIRSFLNVAEVGLIYVAVPHLPLADANAVMAMMVRRLSLKFFPVSFP
jgi:hypothetical protein